MIQTEYSSRMFVNASKKKPKPISSFILTLNTVFIVNLTSFKYTVLLSTFAHPFSVIELCVNCGYLRWLLAYLNDNDEWILRPRRNRCIAINTVSKTIINFQISSLAICWSCLNSHFVDFKLIIFRMRFDGEKIDLHLNWLLYMKWGLSKICVCFSIARTSHLF